VLPKLRFPLYQHLTDISFPNGNKITIETKENKTKKYGLKWQSCGAKISYWEVQGSACYFVDIRGADCFHYPAQQYLHRIHAENGTILERFPFNIFSTIEHL